ncbi:MAG: hypothetical protein K6F92_01450 [Lachnospiraceae bacterium]|nr:hypothetical protein [Lachnospiraceae bacterium]
MSHYKRILFICNDNTCRSIMAEAIMKSIENSISEENRPRVHSRGLVVLFSEPINPKAVMVMRKNHLEPAKETSQQFTDADCKEGTLYLTMTEREKRMVEEMVPHLSNLYTLREFVGEVGDINEPYGGTEEDYEMVYEHIDLMVKMVAQKIIRFGEQKEDV